MNLALLEEVLYHLHNWFARTKWSVRGCVISGGALPESVTAMIPRGAFYRIEGSLLNDGLHVAGSGDADEGDVDSLEDETFDGRVTLCAIPKALLALVEEISEWQEKNGEIMEGPYTSESFGGYTYKVKTSSDFGFSQSGGSSTLSGWRLVFRDRLNPWRRMF